MRAGLFLHLAKRLFQLARLLLQIKEKAFLGRKAIVNQWLKRLYDGTTTSVGNDKFNAFPQQYEWDESTVTSDLLIGVDSRYAAELLSRGAPETNEEDIIRRTAKGIAVHAFYEIAISDNQAVVLFDRDHS